ncbi:MAG: enoyl-CoA hydratase/isomerase family protein [Rhodospirillaceae bacterium]|nr:enoyl-CoA hydratase/isomerase family protein [Rhodospirillaceae bacterium]MDE0619003.1 enoyl-CoA hydratase/isomerase family protein [Rhodospirillaceae bacterium]
MVRPCARVVGEDIGAVRVLTLDNEAKRNAFSGSMADDLLRLFREADATAAVRCVVVTGAGRKAFSSGHDLTEVLGASEAAVGADANRAFVHPANMAKPVIAAVNGAAYAGGFILALSCDLRVASRNAAFCVPGARIGLLPIGGQLSRLLHVMPHARALEMALTAQPMTAGEAHGLGFVNRLVPEGEALPAALALAADIAANSPAVARAIKRGVDVSLRKGVAAGEAWEWETGPALAGHADAEEGVRAFLEKRRPRFEDS